MKISDVIINTAKVIGSAQAAYQKAKAGDTIKKPDFVAGLSAESGTAWGGGSLHNADAAQMRAARNSWFYTGVNTKALDLSFSKIDVYNNPTGLEEDGVKAEGHPFLKTLRRPNPYMGKSLLFQYLEWWMELSGEAFWFLEPGDGAIKGIWTLPSNKMDIEFSDDGKSIKRYIAKLQRWYYIDPNYIVHFKYPNPWDFFRGLPPLIAFMLTIDADLAMKMWNGSFFGKDNVMPNAIISLGTGNPDTQFEQADVDTVRADLAENYSAIKRKTAVVSANTMAVALLGYNSKDMDFLAGMGWNKDEVLEVLGVPSSMVDKNSTEANSKVGNKRFKDNMWGLKGLIADEITTQILQPFYAKTLEARFEDDRVYDREMELKEAVIAKDAMPREMWAQKYFNVELAPGDITMSEAKANQDMQAKQQAGVVFNNNQTNKPLKKKSKATSNTVPNSDVSTKAIEVIVEDNKSVGIIAELIAFQNKSYNWYKAGRLPRITFTSKSIDEDTIKSIISDLQGVEKKEDIDEIFAHWNGTIKGGSGSGDFEHKGRPGEVGGSSRNGVVDSVDDKGYKPKNDPHYRIDKLLNSNEVLSKLNIPSKMYHITSRENADKIKREGLVPGKQRSTSEGISRGVYLSPISSKEEFFRAGGDSNIKDPVVLQIDTTGLNLRLDPEFFGYDESKENANLYVEAVNNDEEMWAMYSRETIPPNKIKIIKAVSFIQEGNELGNLKGGAGSGDLLGHEFHGNQWTVVSSYKNTGYRDINNKLREGKYNQLSNQQKETVSLLDELTTSNTLDKPTTLYRVIEGKRINKLYTKVGDTISDSAFMSTSTNENRAWRAVEDANGGKLKNPTLLQIEMPAGSQAFDIQSMTTQNPIASFSQGNEQEVLLPRNSSFRIQSYDENTGKVILVPISNWKSMDINNLKALSWRPWSAFEGNSISLILDALNNVLNILLDNASETMVEDDSIWQQISNAFKIKTVPLFQDIATQAATDVQQILSNTGISISFDLTNSRAKEWVLQYAGDQIKGITDTEKKAVKEAINEWIVAGRDNGIEGLKERLRNLKDATGIPLYGEQRAQRIATSEATSIYAGATEASLVFNGYPPTVYKPRAHVNCRCYIQGKTLSDGSKVIIWYTARDERVCTLELETPFGTVQGCKELHLTIISEGRAGEKWTKDM